MLSCYLALLVFFSADPVVLENQDIRIEIDPVLFSVRFVGIPGGANFIEPVFLSEKERASNDWLDPGGLVTDLAPGAPKDAALRRGPASILEQSATHLILLGPESPECSLQIKKEFHLLDEEAGFQYKVTVLSSSAKGQDYAIRNMLRIPSGATLQVPRSGGDFTTLHGQSAYAIVQSNRYWLLPIPPTHPTPQTILGAKATEVSIKLREGVLTRRLLAPSQTGGKLPQEVSLLCLIDDETRSYGVALQGAIQSIRAGAPLVLSEEWRLKKRSP